MIKHSAILLAALLCNTGLLHAAETSDKAVMKHNAAEQAAALNQYPGGRDRTTLLNACSKEKNPRGAGRRAQFASGLPMVWQRLAGTVPALEHFLSARRHRSIMAHDQEHGTEFENQTGGRTTGNLPTISKPNITIRISASRPPRKRASNTPFSPQNIMMVSRCGPPKHRRFACALHCPDGIL